MNILFYDHSFHKKTRSSDFFVEFLRSFATVDIKYIDPNDELRLLFEPLSDVDVYIFWQIFPSVKQLKKLPQNKVVFIPMYDGCCTFTYNKWNKYRGFRFISFCRKVHFKLTDIGIDSIYIQYMPPQNLKFIDSKQKEDKVTIFIWKRTPSLNLAKLFYQLKANGIEKAICHGFERSERILCEGIEIEYTENWFKDHNCYINTVAKCHYFFSPRLYEGIGMGFLEAMSLGVCVIAPNQATMNEYIVDKETGYLFNNFDDIKIDTTVKTKMASLAIKSCDNIRQSWMQSKESVIEFILKKDYSVGVCKNPIIFIFRDLELLLKFRLVPFLRRKLNLQDY